ncbi:hypothetical protein [Salisaeta longa]|nr:hypothetical protein [Salisaeta longa]
MLVNAGSWRDMDWKAMGVGMHEGFAVVWFGAAPDPSAAPPVCP